jgi:flagellar basal-body rod protein FlgB
MASSVIDQLSAAMSIGSLAHRVAAQNVANRDAQSHQRMKVEFDSAMAAAGTSAARVVPDTAGGAVSLEQDLVAMASNAAHYQSMARVLSRYFSIATLITNPARG